MGASTVDGKPHRYRPVCLLIALAVLLGGWPGLVSPTGVGAVSAALVISQFQVAGTNPDGTSRPADEFVGLHNVGNAAVDLSGHRLVYRSAAGTSDVSLVTWTASASIPAGGYYLVAATPGYDNGGAVAAEATFADGGSGRLAAAGGGLALRDAAGTIVDSVGYGTATNAFVEGSATAAPAANAGKARPDGGCRDTDNNAADFETVSPAAPRNSGTPPAICGGAADAAPTVSSTTPADGAADVAADATITIGFSEAVNVTGDWYRIECATSGAHAATAGGAAQRYTLDPASDFADGEHCTVTVVAGRVTDADGADPPDAMAADYRFGFTVVTARITRIHEIQGAGHVSPHNGQTVANVPGVVTATRSNGFYLQDPNPDADDATSEAILVFTGARPAVSVGNIVTVVSGRVVEFRPGGDGGVNNLTITQISTSNANVSVTAAGSPGALPAATIIGAGGRVPPTTVIEDDAAGNVETSNLFDPDTDGVDFYESLEAMRVGVNDAVVVGPTNNFGEIVVLADNGADAGVRT
ncbi:MAG: Ig-like domain-containing protein, partial [Chloroflexota bacterium]|nr:Ig-like domain-containing protein [Chloroflexota bacterium]